MNSEANKVYPDSGIDAALQVLESEYATEGEKISAVDLLRNVMGYLIEKLKITNWQGTNTQAIGQEGLKIFFSSISSDRKKLFDFFCQRDKGK